MDGMIQEGVVICPSSAFPTFPHILSLDDGKDRKIITHLELATATLFTKSQNNLFFF